MRKTTSRVLWILVGVLLVITGIACFAHPAATLGSLAILLGIAMLFSGVVDLVIFIASFTIQRDWVFKESKGLLK